MAVDARDPVTGRPIFNDNGAPDTGVDPTEVAKYAAEVGNRIIGTTSYLENYTYRREGLAGYDTTRKCAVVYRGGVWKREVSFRTFTTSRAGMNDGTLYLQVPTEDTAKDTEPAFQWGYNSSTGVITLEAGVYQLHTKQHPGSGMTGFGYVQLRGVTQGILARGPVLINADPWMTCSALFRTDGTEGFYVEMQKTTGNQSAGSGFLNIAKLSEL